MPFQQRKIADVFPFEGMPELAQRIGNLMPLTHFVAIIRGVVLRGAALGELQTNVRALGIFFLLAMAVATLRFRKRLD